MTLSTVTALLIVALAGAVSPVLAELTGGLGVPDVVIQLGFGIILGPEVLAVVHPDSFLTGLSDLGLTYLMFLAGYELDLDRIKGRPLALAGSGWALSVVLALAIAFVLVSAGLALDSVVIGLALTTTALGTLLPVLRDVGLDQGVFGARMMAIGTVGEFGPIVAVAVLLDKRDPVETLLLLAAFLAIAVVSALVALRSHPPNVVAMMGRHLQSSAQLPIRISLLLIVALVDLAFRLGLDVLLGAFAAGVVIRLFAVGDDAEIVKSKLEAIGFGFLIPIFFIVSGMNFNLDDLLNQPSTLLRLPLFLAAFLVVRGTPALLLYRRDLPKNQLLPLALFSATGLPLIVVITTIGVSEGRMLPQNAAALVGAGMLSVLLYPLAAKILLRASPEQPVPPVLPAPGPQPQP
jgi:Kef-type K+ transport system membrane component KefB